MWKQLTIATICILNLQGCVSEGNGKASKQVVDTKSEKKVANDMKEQLIQAAEQQDSKTVSHLIKNGANINVQDSKGRTPTMIATYNNDIETAKLLIDAGAEGYLEILKLTIGAGADPSLINQYGGTALIPAAEHGHLDVIKELLTKTDIDVNHVNSLGWTALLEAIILNNGGKKQQQAVQLLIDHGADVNIPDGNNVTPLQHAREKGFKGIEEILLKAGAK
ncbi:ankyrin repeat domain-containing protein [Heyndrickxia vini]|uniref:Ankyrin repeat domain-containing protein n=1 Tax=Heyndrickxia vini TaxID=1476025 RepID=A0ABX7E556_9BACI|nr:ankyrin repeat domain-containing protein [Heyndrickxia vini]QQZ10414.1 ankyrin repeat domain-containing protein [Heyndrickxia vini]